MVHLESQTAARAAGLSTAAGRSRASPILTCDGHIRPAEREADGLIAQRLADASPDAHEHPLVSAACVQPAQAKTRCCARWQRSLRSPARDVIRHELNAAADAARTLEPGSCLPGSSQLPRCRIHRRRHHGEGHHVQRSTGRPSARRLQRPCARAGWPSRVQASCRRHTAQPMAATPEARAGGCEYADWPVPKFLIFSPGRSFWNCGITGFARTRIIQSARSVC